MDVEVKIKDDMKKLGCKCDKKIVLAYHLYIHLVDEKLMYDTEYCYNKDIDTMYIVARPRKNEKLNIYVPVLTSEDINMDFISILQENLCTVETGPRVILAFIEADFTIVIYTFTKGLAERRSPERITQMRLKEEKRNFINTELKKNKNQILNDALNGGVVDDDCEVLE
ncbi:uncharacterized protein LOC116773674 [Danaus plexippus]|uniref:uncharacterized protein LOC116773674 n=1 Tax=Danaus plexippus TaxID=13037 RepID=UPI002AB2A874|nr:uncharacterized protein LOC116773674 [Danaus plexippus]